MIDGDKVVDVEAPGNGDLRQYAWEDWFSFVVMVVLCVVVAVQVFTRYVYQFAFPWTEEISRMLLIILTFFGSAMAVRKNSHVYIAVFFRLFPRTARRWISTLVDIIQLAFYVTSTILVAKVSFLLANQRLASVDVSLGLVFGAVAVAFAIMSYRSLLNAIRNWKTGTSPLEEDGIGSAL